MVVTGGTGGLGTGVVHALLEQGAEVHIPVLGREIPQEFEHAEHERVHLIRDVDLGEEAQAVEFFASVPAPCASIQLAGGFAMAELADTSQAELERMWRMNVLSCFLACREAVKRMREAGGGGRLVNVAARPALVPTGGMVAYATAKAAVAGLTQALAEELAGEQIWVNAIAPSIIDTPANRAAMPGAKHDEWPTPAQIAHTILALASPDNHCTRGAIVPVYGQS